MKFMYNEFIGWERRTSQTTDRSAKSTVDKSEKQSIMNISTEAIVLKRLTKESESIMTNATNKEVIVNTAAVITKADKARVVFAEAYPDGKTTTMQRKDIIAKLIVDAGLTKAGAGTYLQNFKSKAGIAVKREVVAATA